MSAKTITINPITPLEGHGKIEIFLNEKGNVENAYFQIPELREFERFCEGRKTEDMPILTPRIRDVCPVAHHFASTKALDAAFHVESPAAAKKLSPRAHAFRAYDPCLACATHFAIGQTSLQVNIYCHDRKLLKTIGR